MANTESGDFIDFFVQERVLEAKRIELGLIIDEYAGMFEYPENIDRLGARSRTVGEIQDEIAESESRLEEVEQEKASLTEEYRIRFWDRNIAVSSLVDGTKPIRRVTRHNAGRGPTYDAQTGIVAREQMLYDTGMFRLTSTPHGVLPKRTELYNIRVLPQVITLLNPLVRVTFLD